MELMTVETLDAWSITSFNVYTKQIHIETQIKL